MITYWKTIDADITKGGRSIFYHITRDGDGVTISATRGDIRNNKLPRNLYPEEYFESRPSIYAKTSRREMLSTLLEVVE